MELFENRSGSESSSSSESEEEDEDIVSVEEEENNDGGGREDEEDDDNNDDAPKDSDDGEDPEENGEDASIKEIMKDYDLSLVGASFPVQLNMFVLDKRTDDAICFGFITDEKSKEKNAVKIVDSDKLKKYMYLKVSRTYATFTSYFAKINLRSAGKQTYGHILRVSLTQTTRITTMQRLWICRARSGPTPQKRNGASK
jgi:hypothetical protein